MAEAALAPRRRQRLLADVPADVICTLAQLAGGQRDYVLFTPCPEPGRVTVEAGGAKGGAVLGVIEIEAELTAPLALPAPALRSLQRRLPAGPVVLAVDGPQPGGPNLTRIAALAADGSAAVHCPPSEPDGGSAAGLLRDVPLLPPDHGATLDPRVLAIACRVLHQLCPGAVELQVAHHDLLAALVHGRPTADSDVLSATVAIARMVESQG